MEKYLRHYAEPEVTALDGLLAGWSTACYWNKVLVVPACNESPGFLRPPPPCDGRSLLILVINQADSASSEVKSANRALADTVRQQFELQTQLFGRSIGSGRGFQLELLRDPVSERDVLLADRFNEGRELPPGGGVGHARKIGADLAAGLIHRQRVRSPWIHCSDADVELPETYFSCSDEDRFGGVEHSALVYPFRHVDARRKGQEPDVLLATQLYEFSLRYYVSGLAFAGSPYAFNTIGSTMAINAAHYAKVRGFPKREAGEDFYLLNKLAKVGLVRELEPGTACKPIEIESRRSDRVPFGTGAAVNRIAGFEDPVRDFRFYHPALFEMLKTWLRSWPGIWRSRSSDLNTIDLEGDYDELGSSEQQGVLVAALEKLKAADALGHAFRQSKDLEQFTRQMHTWFDAFRTLKLIHALRDSHYASVSYAGLGEERDFVARVKKAYRQALD